MCRMQETIWKVAGMTDPLLKELRKLNSELMILSNYQSLLERRITRVFAMLEKKIIREGKV